jgi:hypothetical protein
MVKILRWIGFLLVLPIVYTGMKYLVSFLFTYLYKFFALINPESAIDGLFSYYSASTFALGMTAYGATTCSFYLGLQIMNRGKLAAFYVGSTIIILMFLLSIVEHPIEFSVLGMWEGIGELIILIGQGVGTFVAMKNSKADYTYEYTIAEERFQPNN